MKAKFSVFENPVASKLVRFVFRIPGCICLSIQTHNCNSHAAYVVLCTQYGEHKLEVQPKSNQRFLATHDKEFHSFLKISGCSSRLLNPQNFLLLLWIIINHSKFIAILQIWWCILEEELLKRIFNNLRNSFITMLQQLLWTMDRTSGGHCCKLL